MFAWNVIAVEPNDLLDEHVHHTWAKFRVSLIKRGLLDETSQELSSSWNLSFGSE